MTNQEKSQQERLIVNIQKLLNAKNYTRTALADHLGIEESNVTHLLHNETRLYYDRLVKIADFFSMSVIDLIAYPDQYAKATAQEQEPLEAVLQIKLKKEKKDQVLKLVFGENNIEILNK